MLLKILVCWETHKIISKKPLPLTQRATVWTTNLWNLFRKATPEQEVRKGHSQPTTDWHAAGSHLAAWILFLITKNTAQRQQQRQQQQLDENLTAQTVTLPLTWQFPVPGAGVWSRYPALVPETPQKQQSTELNLWGVKAQDTTLHEPDHSQIFSCIVKSGRGGGGGILPLTCSRSTNKLLFERLYKG